MNAAIYTYAQNCSGSGTFALDAIPRASNIDKITNASGTAIATIDTNNAIRVYFTPKSTTFKYRVTVTMNGQTYQNNSAGVSVTSTAQTYYQTSAIPHTWIPNATSGTLTCKLETLNGTTVIGTNTKTISMTVPASVVPTLGTLSSTPYNTNSIINGWGIYVANYTKARLTCTASGNGGSTIKSFQISGAATTTINGTSLSYDAALSSGGNKTFNVIAIDSRGRSSASKSVTINVGTYFTPSISSFGVIRTDTNGNASENGTAAKLSFAGSYSNIGGNASTAKFSYKLSTATTYTTISTTVAGINGGINGGIIVSNVSFSTASEYDFQIQISDSLGNSVSRTVRLGTVTRTMNVAKYGNGVAIGKMSTIANKTDAGKLEVGWDADFDKNVNIDGNIAVWGTSVVNGNTTLGGALTTTGAINSKNNINMGGLNGQTGELSIRFSNPTTSTYPHNTYFYGGNPSNVNAIGCYDGKNNRAVWSYNDTNNSLSFGNSNAAIYFNGSKMADFVVEQGASGVWRYRKWNSGFAECWGYHTVSGLNISTAWGSWYSSPAIVLPSFPFTFSGTLDIHVSWESDFSAIIDGVGKRESTKAGQVYLYRPVAQTNVNGRFSIYAYGKWK